MYDAKYQTYLDSESQTDSDSEVELKSTLTDPNKLIPKTLNLKQTPARPPPSKPDPIKSNEHLQSLLSAPSDLVPGVYEGGFKTWECSLDLIRYFDRSGFNLSQALKDPNRQETIRVLEIGCGTALPTVWLLFKLFYDLLVEDQSTVETETEQEDSNQSNHHHQLEFHLQDFNQEGKPFFLMSLQPSFHLRSYKIKPLILTHTPVRFKVLYLLTFPNIILAFHQASQLASRSSHTKPEPSSTESESSGDLELTIDLRSSFIQFLTRHHLHLRFFHGPWSSFLLQPSPITFHWVYSSETIYSPKTLNSLIELFTRATLSPLTHLLVAAKSVYFGVGGSTFEFMKIVKATGGEVTRLWPKESDEPDSMGVGRTIMSVGWPSSK